MTGVIKNIPDNKPFGFIRGSDGLEYFFHRQSYYGDWDDLIASFSRNKRVTIEVTFDAFADTPKGPRAEKVQLSDD